MHATLTIGRRELAAYFTSPLAYVFIVIFLVLAGSLTFHVGGWLERGQADLRVFFQWHPWLYLFLVPAVGMRLWAEERKAGTIEFLMTQPISTVQAVLGKFLAAWLFVGIALVLTFPLWEGDRFFLPLVFDPTFPKFYGVLPYRDGRPVGWSFSLLNG